MPRPSIAVTILAAPIVSLLNAQSIVVPNANERTRGSTYSNTLVRNAGHSRTYQLGILASQLSGVPVGAVINGVSFRAGNTTRNPATWPTADVSWSDYEISIGRSIPIESFTGTYATNFAEPPLLVRAGPLLLTASTPFESDPSRPAPQPNDWGEFYFDFHTPFLYGGGPLAISFTHRGSGSSTFTYLDATSSSPVGHGVAYFGSGFRSLSGSLISYAVARIHFGYGVGCPGSQGRVPNLVQNANVGSSGGTLRLAVGNGRPSAVGLLLFGLGATSLPLPNGCTLLTVPAASVPLPLDLSGRGVLPLPVAAGTAGTFNVQAAIADPGATGGYTLSNGVTPSAGGS
ncbi:MAG: hypothetical protein AAF628_30185 [Planctomycetota bacterium]